MRITIINQFYKPDLSPTAHLAASLVEHRVGKPHRDEVRIISSAGGYVLAAALLGVKVTLIGMGLVVVESILAKMRLFELPELLGMSALVAMLGAALAVLA